MCLNDLLGRPLVDLRVLSDSPMLDTADELPAQPGAYLLLMELDAPLALPIAAITPKILQPGWYVYAGNARGPGGMRARAQRHLRQNKICHWHVDHLTTVAKTLYVAGIPDGDECELIGKLLGRPKFETASDGFGSTDCRICQTHLLTVRT